MDNQNISFQQSSLQSPSLLSSNKLPLIFGGIVLLLAVSTGSYLFDKQSTSSVLLSPSPTTIATPSVPSQITSVISTGKPFQASAISQAHNRFGFDIFRKLVEDEDKNKNIFISPSSIALTLTMTYNGATDETKQAMANTLDLNDVSMEDVNTSSRQLIAHLQNPDPYIELTIANAIWAKKGMRFRQEFMDLNQTYFGAKVDTADFTDPATADIINRWASDNTKGKIPTIVDKDTIRNLVMLLANAIYFKGAWTYEFDKTLTQDRPFTASGSTRNHPLMTQTRRDYRYFENDTFQAVALPYGKNEKMLMYVFLPKRDLDDFISSLTPENWQGWLGSFSQKEGMVLLPKFKIEYSKELKDQLISLGMGAAFKQEDFKNMFEEGGLFIDFVIHKTYVDVNEEGTEAAAVTAVEAGRTSSFTIGSKFYMEVNKPFLFAIADQDSGELLFIGAIREP